MVGHGAKCVLFLFYKRFDNTLMCLQTFLAEPDIQDSGIRVNRIQAVVNNPVKVAILKLEVEAVVSVTRSLISKML